MTELETISATQLVILKGLKLAFKLELKSYRKTRKHENATLELWQLVGKLKSEEQNIIWECYDRLEADNSSYGFKDQDQKWESIRLARKIDEAKRKYLRHILDIPTQKTRNAEWAEIGKRLASEKIFRRENRNDVGRPEKEYDLDVTRANAFDTVKLFLKVAAYGTEKYGHIAAAFKEMYSIDDIKLSARISDKLVLNEYLGINALNLSNKNAENLKLFESILELRGAKTETSLLNSISRGRTKWSDDNYVGKGMNHGKLFNLK